MRDWLTDVLIGFVTLWVLALNLPYLVMGLAHMLVEMMKDLVELVVSNTIT